MIEAPKTVVVYGPQGCGKSRNAGALMVRYGCERVQDNWDGVSPIAPGALVMTNVHPPYAVGVDVVVPFGQALAA